MLEFADATEEPQFKDGDIVAVFKKANGRECCKRIAIFDNSTADALIFKAEFLVDNELAFNVALVGHFDIRLATDSEKQQLFDALAKENKRWNPETRAIEDLPKKHEFKTFDKVLVRDSKDERWRPAFFASFDEHCIHDYAYGLVGDPEGVFCKYCIPYEGNESLVGTTRNPRHK